MYAMGRLQQAASRLKAPEVADAFQSWEWFAGAVHQARTMAELRQKAGGMASEATGLQGQLNELRAEMARKLCAAQALQIELEA